MDALIKKHIQEGKILETVNKIVAVIRTSDDWYPNYDRYGNPDRSGRFVKLKLLTLYPHGSYNGRPPYDGGWRVAVWGADDCGMERDFGLNEKDDACALFDEILTSGTVSKQNLTNLGFQRA